MGIVQEGGKEGKEKRKKKGSRKKPENQQVSPWGENENKDTNMGKVIEE